MIQLLLVCISIVVVKSTALMYRDIILSEKCWYQLLSAALLTKCCVQRTVFVIRSVYMYVSQRRTFAARSSHTVNKGLILIAIYSIKLCMHCNLWQIGRVASAALGYCHMKQYELSEKIMILYKHANIFMFQVLNFLLLYEC